MEMIDIPQNLIPDVWPTHAAHRPAHPALVIDGRVYDWSEFCRNVDRAAAGMARAGVAKGDRVAFLMNSSASCLFLICGALRAGACVAPLSTMLRPEQVVALANDSGARLLVADDGHVAALDRLRGEFATLGPAGLYASRATGAWQSCEAILAADTTGWRAPKLALDDESNINYSSGTTGIPKGVVQSHRARQHWAFTFAAGLDLDDGAVALCTTPLYSNATWLLLLPWLLTGGTAVVMPRFDTLAFLDCVERWKATHTFMVPTQFKRLLAEPSLPDRDLGSVRAYLTAGSPMAVETKREVMAALGPHLYELYGMSEGGATLMKPRDMQRNPASVGRPMPGFEVKVLDEDREVPVGADGEIAFHGGWAMRGYNNNPEATAAAVWRDREGRSFIRSGDIGRIDADGFVYVHDRKKDMIISGGFNVYPIDIERVLERHPAVQDVAVIGIPHPDWGERPLAVVVARDGGRPDADALRAWANAQLAATQRLSQVILADALPRNPTGKVLKRELRAAFSALASP